MQVSIEEKNIDLSHSTLLHDTAHVLASALKALYKDNIQITIGPDIKNGFYYDVDANFAITPDHFAEIESKMLEIASKNLDFVKEVWGKQEAIEYFKSIGEHYKVEIINSINDEIFIYKHGDFMDLCRGPHLDSTKHVRHFKLLRVAGAYWRGDSKNKMLQRIYGTAFFSKAELDNYLHILEEAEKRDHRKIGKELGFFHLQEEAQGMPFWHKNGWTLNLIIEEYMRARQIENGYEEVKTPMIYDRVFWEKSGHWEKFHDNMFSFNDGHKDVAVKPMNCPAHVQIFNQSIKSYRDLPLRISEFGSCHRNEPSGALHGLMRVRGFRQDDGHIFCTLDQITQETVNFTKNVFEVYKDFGFEKIKIKFSDRPNVRSGSDETWDKAEDALLTALKASGLEYEVNKGEGAFYGPKIEFVLIDALEREWQCGTVQIDMVLPERLGAQYIDSDGQKQYCVMIHRAILGSFERFIGILIEHYAGNVPFWLSPVQVVILKISDNIEELNEYACKVYDSIKNIARVENYIGSGTISKKIAECVARKVPLLIILGKNEASEGMITLRVRGSNEKQTIALDNLEKFLAEIK